MTEVEKRALKRAMDRRFPPEGVRPAITLLDANRGTRLAL
jgi:hypothetical protein